MMMGDGSIVDPNDPTTGTGDPNMPMPVDMNMRWTSGFHVPMAMFDPDRREWTIDLSGRRRDRRREGQMRGRGGDGSDGQRPGEGRGMYRGEGGYDEGDRRPNGGADMYPGGDRPGGDHEPGSYGPDAGYDDWSDGPEGGEDERDRREALREWLQMHYSRQGRSLMHSSVSRFLPELWSNMHIAGGPPRHMVNECPLMNELDRFWRSVTRLPGPPRPRRGLPRPGRPIPDGPRRRSGAAPGRDGSEPEPGDYSEGVGRGWNRSSSMSFPGIGEYIEPWNNIIAALICPQMFPPFPIPYPLYGGPADPRGGPDGAGGGRDSRPDDRSAGFDEPMFGGTFGQSFPPRPVNPAEVRCHQPQWFEITRPIPFQYPPVTEEVCVPLRVVEVRPPVIGPPLPPYWPRTDNPPCNSSVLVFSLPDGGRWMKVQHSRYKYPPYIEVPPVAVPDSAAGGSDGEREDDNYGPDGTTTVTNDDPPYPYGPQPRRPPFPPRPPPPKENQCVITIRMEDICRSVPLPFLFVCHNFEENELVQRFNAVFFSPPGTSISPPPVRADTRKRHVRRDRTWISSTRRCKISSPE